MHMKHVSDAGSQEHKDAEHQTRPGLTVSLQCTLLSLTVPFLDDGEEIIYTYDTVQKTTHWFINKILGSPYASKLRQNRGEKSGKV